MQSGEGGGSVVRNPGRPPAPTSWPIAALRRKILEHAFNRCTNECVLSMCRYCLCYSCLSILRCLLGSVVVPPLPDSTRGRSQ